MSGSEDELKTPVCGYPFVSLTDGSGYRDIAFCGHFPADNPQYVIMVSMHKREDKDNKQKIRTDLGTHAANVCKNVINYLAETM